MPYGEKDVGIVNTDDDSWTTIPTNSDTSYNNKTLVGTKIYSKSNYSSGDNVGIVNTDEDSWVTISTGLSNGIGKYSSDGVWDKGTKIYFTPLTEDSVGVVDTSDDTFTTISTGDVTDDSKYVSATLVDNTIYFTPFNQDNVGVLSNL